MICTLVHVKKKAYAIPIATVVIHLIVTFEEIEKGNGDEVDSTFASL